ncbi:MAG: hypothetical protein CL867_02545 [Cytophagaceae bacterium]|nr:hypothetical protein [Cytophagaceae bacterium]
MKRMFLTLCCALFLLPLNAQRLSKGSITTSDNLTIEGRLAINYATNQITIKEGYDTRLLGFDRVIGVELNGKAYTKQMVGDQTYFVNAISDQSGIGQLYQINKNAFLITKANGTSQAFDLKEDKARVPGILAVLFNDCNTIRDRLYQNSINDRSDVIAIFDRYANCDKGNYAPTASEIERANAFGPDQMRFYVGGGAGLNRVTINDASDTESMLSGQIGVGVIASPNFFGSLQGNLFFSLEAQAAFAGEKDFTDGTTPLSFRTNTYRLLAGLEYHFNKNGAIVPIVGVHIGPTSDHFKGNYNGLNFNIDGGNPIFAPKVGARFKMNNDHYLGVMVQYISDYSNELSFPSGDTFVNLDVKNQYVTLGLNYYF